MKKIFLLLFVFGLLFTFNFSFSATFYKETDFLNGLNLGTPQTTYSSPNRNNEVTTTITYEDGSKKIIIPNGTTPFVEWQLSNGAVYKNNSSGLDQYVQEKAPAVTTPATVSNTPTNYQPLVPEVSIIGNQISGGQIGTGNDLNVLLNSIVYIIIGFAVVLAIFMIIKGGYEYMTSNDSGDKKTAAKRRLQAAFGGLLLAVGAVLILNTINPSITNFTIQFPGIRLAKPVVLVTLEQRGDMTYEEMEKLSEELRNPTGEKDALGQVDWSNEKEITARNTLAAMGVLINKGDRTTSSNGYTEVGGLQESTLNGIQQLLQDAGIQPGENVMLTGGSENYTHSGSGTKNHHTGYKADFRGNLGSGEKSSGDIKLDTFLNNKLGSGNAMRSTTLSSGQTITILKESNHWDIKFH